MIFNKGIPPTLPLSPPAIYTDILQHMSETGVDRRIQQVPVMNPVHTPGFYFIKIFDPAP